MDPRLEKRIDGLVSKIETHQSIVVHQISSNEAEQRAYYRLLQNERLSVESLSAYIISDCQRQIKPGEHYLVFQDTTQPNLESKRFQIKADSGLGVIGDNLSLGFFLHPGLVLHAETYRCLGYSYLHTWSRHQEKPRCKDRNYRNEPIEEKESYRWLDCTESSRLALSSAGLMTIVSDQEGDIFEVFDRLPAKTHMLVRSKADRTVLTKEGKIETIKSYIQSQPICGMHQIDLKEDQRKNRSKRKVEVEIRIGRVQLLAPLRLSSSPKKRPRDQLLSIVEVKEVAGQCPEGEKPLHWTLVTTHQVDSLDDSLKIIKWYKARWNAEQVFRLAKRKGFNIEASDLETGYAIIKMALLALWAASKVILLHQASKEQKPIEIEDFFSEDQQKCMEGINLQIEGKTKKQQNPYQMQTIQWVYWVVARLGGWKPHEKQAGVIVLLRGWKRFLQIYEGWTIAKDVS